MDLDVWILLERSNAERLVAALDDLGMQSVGLDPVHFLEPGIVVQLGYPPVRIDLITSATGVDFDECWENRVMVGVGQVEAGFISGADLIKNERAVEFIPDVSSIQGHPTIWSVAT